MPRSSDHFAMGGEEPGHHAGRGALSAGGAALLGAALVVGPGPAAAETNCFAATDAMTAGRWAEAVPLLEARLEDPACASQTGSLRYSLAYAIEKLAEVEPARACAAADHYAAVAVDDAAITAAAAAGRARMDEVCRAVSSEIPEAAEAPAGGEVDRTTAIGLTVGAGLAAVAGGALLFFGVRADGERADALAAMRAAHADGHQVRRDAAEAELEDAAARATVLGLSGWGALAVAAGLGAAATWAWVDEGPAITVGAGQVGVSGRF